MQLPDRPRPVPVTLPLRILVIKSQPAGFPALDLAAEWAQVAEALSGLTDSGSLAFTELAEPTLEGLQRALVRETFHILHYMGHGMFDAEHGGALLFTDRAGRGVPVTSTDLGVMLHDHTSLRLAVLNACEAGRTDPADPFAGVADTLMRRGIPAVVAMQFDVSDEAAVKFAPALYGALAAGRPVDAAVAEARKAIYTVNRVEWATPVLYLRADNAVLFNVRKPIAQDPTAAERFPGAEAAHRDAPQPDPVLKADSAVNQETSPTSLTEDQRAQLRELLPELFYEEHDARALLEKVGRARGQQSSWHNPASFWDAELRALLQGAVHNGIPTLIIAAVAEFPGNPELSAMNEELVAVDGQAPGRRPQDEDQDEDALPGTEAKPGLGRSTRVEPPPQQFHTLTLIGSDRQDEFLRLVRQLVDPDADPCYATTAQSGQLPQSAVLISDPGPRAHAGRGGDPHRGAGLGRRGRCRVPDVGGTAVPAAPDRDPRHR